MCWISSEQKGKVENQPRIKWLNTGLAPGFPAFLTHKVLALLRVDPDDANLELGREIEREARPGQARHRR